MSEDEPKLSPDLTERDLLFRIARELGAIRKICQETAYNIRAAESEVPESLRRFANYMHDIHDIKFMYEELGHVAPEHVKQELLRCDDRYRQILDMHHSDGGALEKVRREMAADPANRWDHTRALEDRSSG